MQRGYTAAARYVIGFADGSSAFVKAAVDGQTSAWLRIEQRVYDRVDADFVPRRLAWEDGDLPLMLFEDLSDGIWTFAWSPDNVARTRRLLERLAGTILPADFPRIEDDADEFRGWQSVAADPAGFLSLELASAGWLSAALPALLQAERAIRLDGTAFVHMDVRSDNLCFHGERTLLVAWNWARRGNPAFDQVFWLPTVHMEGGRAPWDITLAEPEIIAAAAGYFCNDGSSSRPCPGSPARSACRCRMVPMPERHQIGGLALREAGPKRILEIWQRRRSPATASRRRSPHHERAWSASLSPARRS